MALLKVICWALIFIIKIRFPPGKSLATIYIHTIRFTVIGQFIAKYGNDLRSVFICNSISTLSFVWGIIGENCLPPMFRVHNMSKVDSFRPLITKLTIDFVRRTLVQKALF